MIAWCLPLGPNSCLVVAEGLPGIGTIYDIPDNWVVDDTERSQDGPET